MLHNSGMTYD